MLRPLCRTLLPLAAVLVLLPAAAGAAPHPPGSRPVAATGWLARGWEGLIAWWAALDGGCGIDPDGRCRQAAPPEGTDGGCGIDPSGGCRQAAPPEGTDNGCMIDPNGCAGR